MCHGAVTPSISFPLLARQKIQGMPHFFGPLATVECETNEHPHVWRWGSELDGELERASNSNHPKKVCLTLFKILL